jgi:hypothetical protein
MIAETDAKEVVLYYLWHNLQVPRHEVKDDYVLNKTALMAIDLEVSVATGTELALEAPLTVVSLVKKLTEQGHQRAYFTWLKERQQRTTGGK